MHSGIKIKGIEVKRPVHRGASQAEAVAVKASQAAAGCNTGPAVFIAPHFLAPPHHHSVKRICMAQGPTGRRKLHFCACSA